MDPLSITASAITLIDAAASLYRFLSTIPQAEVKFAELCLELNRLTDVLHSIDAIRNEVRRNVLAFAPVDQDLWKQSEVAFSDCKKTLDELTAVVERIRGSTSSRTVLRRMRLATDLRFQAKDLASFQERIYTSNISFQTLLQVLNVSLSIRSNKSQQDIFAELKKLKRAIDASQYAIADSSYSIVDSFTHKQIVNNQKELIRAARTFYSTASSTASTRHGTVDGSQAAISNLPSTRTADRSVNESDDMFSLPSPRRRQIEDYLADTSDQYAQRSSQTTVHGVSPIQVPSRKLLTDLTVAGVMGDHLSPDSQFDLDHVLYTGMRHLAQQFIWSLEFAKAEDVLRQALRQCKSLPLEEPHQVRMRVQLVLVGFLQGRGRDMEASVLDLAKHQVNEAIGSQLIYILILANVLEKDHSTSKRLFPELLHGTTMSPTKIETMRLLAASYRLAGDPYQADAIEVMFPTLKSEKGLPTVMDFILRSDELMLELVGLNKGSQVQHFKNDLVKAEKQSQRQVPRSPMRIRWLREKSRRTSVETTVFSVNDNETDDRELTKFDPNMRSDKGPVATEPEGNKSGHVKWWRRAKLSDQSFKDMKNAFFNPDKDMSVHRKFPPRKHDGRESFSFWAEAGGTPEETDESIISALEPDFAIVALPTPLLPPPPSPSPKPTPTPSMEMVENQAVCQQSIQGQLTIPLLVPAELHDNCIPAELPDTGLTPIEIIQKHAVFHSRAENYAEPGNRPSAAFSTYATVQKPKIDHGNAPLNIFKVSRPLATLLYDPPTITQTLADYVTTLRLEKALSQYPSSVTEGKGQQGGTVDSGYGSGQGSRSIPNVYPGDPRRMSHERHLRILLGLKITIPVTENSFKDIDLSKLIKDHQPVSHNQGTGAKFASGRVDPLRNQEKVEGCNLSDVSRAASASGQASQGYNAISLDTSISAEGRAVAANEPCVLQHIRPPARRSSQAAKVEHGHAQLVQTWHHDPAVPPKLSEPDPMKTFASFSFWAQERENPHSTGGLMPVA